jgi:GT2 family glycosyltransferase
LQNDDSVKFGAVAIGRNEGARLRRCLESLSAAATVVYVDSGSTDGSVQLARDHRVEVIELDRGVPFTAARARNAGFRHLRKIAPDLVYIQFVDGDCELIEGWFKHATCFLNSQANVAAVSGRLFERYPNQSVYNWLCDREWDGPVGEVRLCGGIAMMRATALDMVGGFRDQLIAGEEPDLCVRLRAAGWRVWRLDNEMGLHDAAMTRFDQWWRRTIRNGYAFAQGAHMHGASPERHWVWESRRAWLWGVWLPLAFLMTGLEFGPWGWAIWLIYPLQITRQIIRNPGPLRHRTVLALFQMLARFPESLGQMRFIWDRLRARQANIIEYK